MKRWPVIRHLRYCWHRSRMEAWYALWASYGYVVRAESDDDTLNAIWRGEY